MKTTALGIVGGLVLGISVVLLYEGFAFGMLSCGVGSQSTACETNFRRTAFAEAGTAIGVASTLAALWMSRAKRRSQA